MREKILIIGPAWVGDMVMAQPLFDSLKQMDPNVALTVLAPAWTFPLLERMPQVDQAKVMPIGHGQLALKARFHLGRALRREQYQQAIVLPNSWKSALIPFFAKIPTRTGWQGEYRYGLLNDLRILDQQKYVKMVERFIALAYPKASPLPKLYTDPKLTVSRLKTQQALATFGLSTTQPILALCPGAEFGSAKRWPVAHFASLAEQKIAQGFEVWLLGSKNDLPVAQDIMRLVDKPVVNLVGRTDLAQAIDLLSCVQQVVSNDSGLMHIACSLNKPVVALFGPTPMSFAPPLSKRAKMLSSALPCMPCRARECPLGHQNCMKMILPETVLAALAELECVF